MAAPHSECQPDIVERLRHFAKEGAGVAVLIDAAARIEELERILRECRRFIDPDCDPSALTNRALTLQINRALAPSLERSGGAT